MRKRSWKEGSLDMWLLWRSGRGGSASESRSEARFGVSSIGNSGSSVTLVLQMQMMTQVPLSVTLRREGSCGGLNYRLVRPPPFRLRGTLLPARLDSLPSLFNVIRFYVPTSALVDKTEL